KRALMPDRRSDWPLPKADQVDYQSSLLGFKLSCGFELLKRQGTLKKEAPSLPRDQSLIEEVVKEVALDRSFLVRFFRLD
uniref:Uncharacterized protein n=1 Tax=Plectus sambesii TaxID=2011161 RepID=A0A914X5H8_9BILA